MNRTNSIVLSAAIFAFAVSCPLRASTVAPGDPSNADGGIGYRFNVTMNESDLAVFASHVGAWSWEDEALFNPANGEPPVGWTHTSNWVALHLNRRAALTIRIERDPNVPWPSESDPNRVASTASMFPSFTIWRNWDNDPTPIAFRNRPDVIEAFEPFGGVPPDLGDWHTYNNRGSVEWAEDLGYRDHLGNSTLETIERTYLLEPGRYSIVIGSNSPATDPNRQGYKATFTTRPDASDSYYIANPNRPFGVPASFGVLSNDTGLSGSGDVAQLTTPPVYGQVLLNGDGSFTYTPGPLFVVETQDRFEYRVLIGGDANAATGEIAVTLDTLHAASGWYAGFLRDDADGAVNGLVRFKVTKTGNVTGTVTSSGITQRLFGLLSSNGAVQLPRGGELRLGSRADGQRHGTLLLPGDTGGGHYSSVKRSPFSARTSAPFAGKHILDLTTNFATEGAPDFPASGQVTIGENGAAHFVLRLGARVLTGESVLVPGDAAGVGVPLYSPVYPGRAGSISGELLFGNSVTSNAAGYLDLIKPPRVEPAADGFTIYYEATTARPE